MSVTATPALPPRPKVTTAAPVRDAIRAIDRLARAKGADDGLEDAEVSGQHCQIQILSGKYHLFDLNSTNGTFINSPTW